MKRISCLLICLIMLLIPCAEALADADSAEDLAAVLNEIKPRIPCTDVYDEFSSGMRNHRDGVSYDFEWSKNAENISKHLAVSVNDEGIITSYYKYDGKRNYGNKPSINRLAVAQVLKNTAELVKKLNPALNGKIRLIAPQHENLYSNEYTINIQRIENDIEVSGDTGYVTVDGSAESIISFNLNYTCGLNFERSTDFISYKDAVNSYNENIGLKLVYDMEYSHNRENKVVLKYVPALDNDKFIDAQTGSLYEANFENFGGIGSYNSSAEKAMLDSASGTRFSAAEKQEIAEIAELLSAEDIKKSIFANTLLSVSEDSIVKENSVTRDYYNKNRYYHNFSLASNDGRYWYNISCDALTGDLIRYNRYDYSSDDKENKISEIAAKEKADEIIHVLASDYFNPNGLDTYVREVSEADTNQVNYKRTFDGIECRFDGINASVSMQDGKLNSFAIRHTDVQFPESDNAVDKEAAIRSIFDSIEYYVIYLPVFENGISHAACVYDFKNHVVPEVDALSGETLNIKKTDDLLPYSDIEGHYAKEQIEALRRFGIGFSGGLFRPEKEITQGEYLVLLNSIFGGYASPVILKEDYDYSSASDFAIRDGIVSETEIQTSQTLTRRSASVMLVKAMGYSEIAELDNIYKSEFSDVGENVGYISILKGMGVVTGDGNGRFLPETKLTRADASVILYNYLSK